MHIVVFIPGIMGTRLALKKPDGSVDEVWPPTPLETKFGYKRIDDLMKPAVYPTTLISSVLCFQFYSTITDLLGDLGFTEGGATKKLVLFPYDWRQDLFKTVEVLAAKLDAIKAEKATKISIVAHSMGGLITRLLLESGQYNSRKWFGKIDQFVALAVPHLGAPLALARVLGLDPTLGVSGADFIKFSSSTAYPSGYQLLPPRAEICCWDQASANLAGLDIYDPATAKRLGLSSANLKRAAAVHDVLNTGAPPKGVRYFYFAGTGHRTVSRVNVFAEGAGPIDHERSEKTLTPDGGDGTVPLYSALPRQGQRQMVVNEHSTVFEGDPFRRVFVRLLGGNEGPAIEAVKSKAPPLALSVEAPVVPVGHDIEIVMAISPSALSGGGARRLVLSGEFLLERAEDEAVQTFKKVGEFPIAYDGPAIDRLSMLLPAQAVAAHYRLTFKGNHKANGPAVFAVSAA
jgi:phospholipase A1